MGQLHQSPGIYIQNLAVLLQIDVKKLAFGQEAGIVDQDPDLVIRLRHRGV